ncbi:MAG TPA: hypothetical protein VIA18_18755, partial [Polyangia bacterium]|nr:hypothetical protein [Polyangia bacterium]
MGAFAEQRWVCESLPRGVIFRDDAGYYGHRRCCEYFVNVGRSMICYCCRDFERIAVGGTTMKPLVICTVLALSL